MRADRVGVGVCRAGRRWWVGRAEVLAGAGSVETVDELRVAEVDAAEVDAADVGVAGRVAGRGAVKVPDLQADSSVTAVRQPMIRTRANRAGTRPACHDVPMRIRGCAVGVSQRMIEISFAWPIATHPAVGPVPRGCTCRKNALPAPWRTPPGAFRVL